MTRYSRHVDRRSRTQMVDFLANHFRYDTMNSWNKSTSYACNMKIHRLGLDREIEDKLYELLNFDEYADHMACIRQTFAGEHNFQWQAGMNGRSGGYLVLYRGGIKPSGYMSYCRSCGQQNYTSVTETGDVCGRCASHSRQDYPSVHRCSFVYPGQSVDQDEDYITWTLDGLRDRVELVQAFDRLADSMVDEAVWMTKNCAIEEETVRVAQTRRVLVPV